MNKTLLRSLTLVGLTVVNSACYHATVDTGRPPSGVRIKRPFAASFISGLIPPGEVETMSRCPDGVARVETQIGVLNLLVSSLTFGLFSPMSVTVECAAPESRRAEERVLPLPAGADAADLTAALDRAAQLVLDGEASVLVQTSLPAN